MTNETEDITEQSTDSLSENPNLSSDDMQTKIVELEAEKKDLNSRVGDMARKMGEQERDLEGKYQEWYQGLQTYYDEQLKSKDGAITNLEQKLVEADEHDGARLVLEERQHREQAAAEAENERRERQVQQKQAIQTTIQQAISAFPDVEPSALGSATTSEQVWKMAGELSNKMKETQLDDKMNALKEELLAAVKPNRDAEVPAQEEASRTPGTSRGSETASTSRRDGTNAANAGLIELEERYEQARKGRKLAVAVALQGEIISYKRQHGLQ